MKEDLKKNYKKILITLSCCLLLLMILNHIRINLTPSSPLGFYYIYKSKKFKKGDYIVYEMPNEYKKYTFNEMRDILTVKKIAAIQGDKISVRNKKIYINNVCMGKMLDGIPTTLPEELVLDEKEVLTLSDRDDSLDGRYYGTIKIKDIKSNAILLKTINHAKIK